MCMMTLLQYRNWKKLTQAALAEELGVTQGTVSKLCDEDLGYVPSLRLAVRIEKATGGAVPVAVWAKTQAGAA